MTKLKILDLFSGIGGFSVGLERTGGFETAAFCEIDAEARAVLHKHWPSVPVFEDVTKLTKGVLDEKGISIDVICGGFPCQDISVAGGGAGLAGGRSGLWYEYSRIIEEVQPKFVFIENVSVLRSRGLEQVLGSLAALGYDAEWHCIPASSVGSPHRRDRIWILAYPSSQGLQRPVIEGSSFPLATRSSQSFLGDLGVQTGVQWERLSTYLRVGNGLPCEPHRLKQLGNAVVPRIPEMLGNAVLANYKEEV